MNKNWLILLVFLLIPTIVYALSQNEVQFGVERGTITIRVSPSNADEIYSNLIEFNNSNGNVSTASFDCEGGNCQSSNAKRVSFESVNIFRPGNYYFVVTSLSGDDKNKIKKDFSVTANDLYSCAEDGVYIRNNQCLFDATGNLEDKGLKCINGDNINRCTECGCPSENYLCCTNENIEECKNKLGACVLAGDRTLEVEIKGAVEPAVEVSNGCLVNNINIPNGVCANNVLNLGLSSSSSLFAQQCVCNDRSALADLDKDGFDSSDFIGGRDCNDQNPKINPLNFESCNDNNGYDGIDNNCDGVVDLDCSSSCDVDGDRYYSVNAPRYLSLFCTVLGFNGGDCDDNNAAKFLGNNEICEDLIDNNCNNIIDDSNVCVCKIGDQRKYGKVRNDGIEECIDGKNWKIVKGANENPLVFINTQKGSVESGDVDLNVGEEFEIEVKFLCPNGDCDVEVN